MNKDSYFKLSICKIIKMVINLGEGHKWQNSWNHMTSILQSIEDVNWTRNNNLITIKTYQAETEKMISYYTCRKVSKVWSRKTYPVNM